MLNEHKNIDQLFRNKLGDFEKTPPMFVWTNIQSKLNAQRKERRIAIYKTVGVAAAIVLAFMAGWQLTNPTDKGMVQQNRIAEQRVADKNIDSSSAINAGTTEVLSVSKDQIAATTPPSSPGTDRKSTTNLSSLATFAANTSFVNTESRTTSPKVGDVELFSTETEFIDEIHKNFKTVKKLTDWIAAINSDSTVTTKPDSKVVNIDQNKYITTEETAIAFNKPVKNNSGRWSLRAEIAPLFNNQSSKSGQQSDLLYSAPQDYKQQETSAENTISGGMMAGYKVGKRLIIKSGFVYNNIRQTTRNLVLTGGSPLYNVLGGSALASTPAGFVNLDKTGGDMQSNDPAPANSGYLLSSSYAKYSTVNDLKQDIKFIEIPVQATYKLIDKKVNVGLTGGIGANILIGNKATLIGNGENIGSGETANMRSIVYSGAIGLEIGYEITSRITLTVEPRLKHYVSSLSTNKSVNFKPSQMGIVTGLTYSFN